MNIKYIKQFGELMSTNVENYDNDMLQFLYQIYSVCVENSEKIART